jgi:Ca-activated chloride channel family protein
VWDESGEYSQTNKIIQLASQTQHRIFTVGVGSSVSERLVRELAEGTQGACELVNPGEGMAEKIEHHFKRIYSEQAKSITVEWSTQPSWQTQPKHFFIGDTLHILATFQEEPQGTVKLTADFGNDLHMQQSAC